MHHETRSNDSFVSSLFLICLFNFRFLLLLVFSCCFFSLFLVLILVLVLVLILVLVLVLLHLILILVSSYCFLFLFFLFLSQILYEDIMIAADLTARIVRCVNLIFTLHYKTVNEVRRFVVVTSLPLSKMVTII